MRAVTDRLPFYCKITIIVSCQLTLINSALSDERDAIIILSRRTYRSIRGSLFTNSERINILSAGYYAQQRESFDKSFVARERSRILRVADASSMRAGRWRVFEHTVYMYTSTLSCFPARATTHRQHPATGQSGILFSKPPRLNQRIALNGALLVIPPFPFSLLGHSRMNYSYPRLNSARGSDSLKVSQKYRSRL